MFGCESAGVLVTQEELEFLPFKLHNVLSTGMCPWLAIGDRYMDR